MSTPYERLEPKLAKHAVAFTIAKLVYPGLDIEYPIAICWRESRGNHLAVSPDGGFGLMQLTKGFHDSWLAAIASDGVPLWQKPVDNFLEGVRLFLKNLDIAINTGFAYDDAVVVAIAGYNASLSRVIGHGHDLTGNSLLLAVDSITTQEPIPYVQDVLATAANFRALMEAA